MLLGYIAECILLMLNIPYSLYNIQYNLSAIFAALSAGSSLPDLSGGGKSGQHRATHRLMAGSAIRGKKVPQKITARYGG